MSAPVEGSRTAETVPPVDASGSDADESPRVQVTRGNPSDDELAALVTVLMAASANSGVLASDELGDRPRAGGWKSYYRVLRRPLVPGRDAWRSSYHG